MGYADIPSCATMLAHLRTTYGVVTAEDLEKNRTGLSAEWNPDWWPLKDLWVHIRTAQEFASDNGDPIADSSTAILIKKEI
jgi:hypothetical protein